MAEAVTFPAPKGPGEGTGAARGWRERGQGLPQEGGLPPWSQVPATRPTQEGGDRGEIAHLLSPPTL